LIHQLKVQFSKLSFLPLHATFGILSLDRGQEEEEDARPFAQKNTPRSPKNCAAHKAMAAADAAVINVWYA
jgi:hypothetical protein